MGKWEKVLKAAAFPLILAALWLVVRADLPPGGRMEALAGYFSTHSMLSVGAFCVLHLVASSLSLPGACTALNLAAGTAFGFWAGCLVVYPVTMLSALIGYAIGGRVNASALGAPLRSVADSLRGFQCARDIPQLVLLRLSPLLPFNLVNLSLGAVGTPLPVYLVSTFLGVFFDVTLLVGLGARFITANGAGRMILAGAFLVFLAIAHVSGKMLPRFR